ncbi:hypothetical protein CAP48_04920 [Advenella sp. S44]|nr:hypothetical protein CAP48_04920 [Advenella sp. S44]
MGCAVCRRQKTAKSTVLQPKAQARVARKRLRQRRLAGTGKQSRKYRDYKTAASQKQRGTSPGAFTVFGAGTYTRVSAASTKT